MDSTGSRNDWVTGIGAVSVGLGTLMFALFPLAIPILLLTVVALLPLAVPLIALALIAAILAAVWLTIRAVGRGFHRLSRRPRGAAAPTAQTETGRRALRPRPLA